MRSLLQIVLTGALLVACTTVRAVQPADLSPSQPPTRVWVTYADHTTVVLDSARVSGDTLIGSVNGEPERIPLSAATFLRARRSSPERTAALWAALSVGALAAVAVPLITTNTYPKRAPPICALPDCFPF